MKGIARALLFVVALAGAPCAAGGQDAWNGTAGLLHVESASTVGRGKLVFSLGSSYYQTGETLTRGPLSLINGTTLSEANADFYFFLSRAALTFGLSDYVEFSAALDVRNWIMQPASEDRVSGVFDTRTRGGLGDTKILLKLCPPVPTKYVSVCVLGEASFPTGNKEARFTTGSTDFEVKGLLSLNLTDTKRFIPARLHLNLGYRFNENENSGYGILYANNPDSSGFFPPAYPRSPAGHSDSFNDVVQFGAGLEFFAKRSSLFLEFSWDNYLNANFLAADSATYYLAGSKNLYTLTPGVKLMSDSGIGAMLAVDFNLNAESNRSFVHPPDWAVYFTISVGGNLLPRDRDKDGIEDKVDKCPDQPEDVDGFEDSDGCPDLDNDNDGIPDTRDKCPDLAEDFDGFQDSDGCPDLDNDGDGIPDVRDKCPNEPEDFDGVQDDDGCPDIVQDSDNDGVPDDKDRCPLVAEDMDGFQDDDGCPDERPIEESSILHGVSFESGSAALTRDSYPVLDQVVKSLKAYPGVKVEIAGYTDDVGNDGQNRELSRRRADAVRQYIVNAGIGAERVAARGYGESNPVASNKTPAGRAENRRIEFHKLS